MSANMAAAAPGDAPTTAMPATPLPPPAPPPPPPPPPQKVHILLRTSPPRHAKVFWGKKLLGETPIDIERLQGSGPMDLVLKADEYFPLHTRAYTDGNDKLTVTMTKLSDRMSLFGARAEVPPPPASAAAPPATPTASGGTTPSSAPPVNP